MLSPAYIAKLIDRLLRSCRHAQGMLRDTPCWVWTKSRCNKGYAQATYCEGGVKRWKRAHILLWELVTGRAVRDRYTLDHLCRNTACIRPDHME